MKQYLIDSQEADSNDIINAARELDDDFDKSPILQTSIAAKILRDNGRIVENNPEFKQ